MADLAIPAKAPKDPLVRLSGVDRGGQRVPTKLWREERL